MEEITSVGVVIEVIAEALYNPLPIMHNSTKVPKKELAAGEPFTATEKHKRVDTERTPAKMGVPRHSQSLQRDAIRRSSRNGQMPLLLSYQEHGS